jgi:TusA-related sulfurtransferase
MAEHILDCKNLNCPMPIVKVSKSIKTMSVGDTLEISATDPAFKADIEAWVRKTGNELVKFTDGQTKIALIKKIIL